VSRRPGIIINLTIPPSLRSVISIYPVDEDLRPLSLYSYFILPFQLARFFSASYPIYHHIVVVALVEILKLD